MPHVADLYAGKRSKLARNLRRVTQSELATHVGLTFQQIQKYEKGANRMGASRLLQFSRFLDVPVSFFFESEEPHPSEALFPMDEDTLRPVANYRSIRDKTSQQLVFNVVALVAKT